MTQQVINNGETGGVVRGKLNDNFTELYGAVAADPYPQVVDHASLPSAAANAGKIYIVQTTTGLIGFRKLAGLWRSDGAAWLYLGLYGRNASEIVNVPGPGSTAIDVQGAIDEIGARTTDGWAEGVTNKYFTNTRADARIGAASINALADVTIAAPTVGQVLKWNGTEWINDVDATGGGGSSLTGTSIITITGVGGAYEWSETVAAPGVLASNSLFAFFAAGGDDDENEAETLDPSSNPVASASLNAITFDVVFREPTSGPIKLTWKVL
jgi:hypothetical protein